MLEGCERRTLPVPAGIVHVGRGVVINNRDAAHPPRTGPDKSSLHCVVWAKTVHQETISD